MIKGFIIGLFCFLVFLFLHVVFFHNRQVKYRFVALAKIFLSLIPVYVILYVLIPVEPFIILPSDPVLTPSFVIGLSKVFNFFIGILIYLLLFFGYCQFYFIIDRSVSVRIMIELEKAKNGKLNLDQIKDIYTTEYMLARRLGQMIDSKYIVEEDGSYRNVRKGRLTAKFFKFLKEYLQLGEGG